MDFDLSPEQTDWLIGILIIVIAIYLPAWLADELNK